MARLEIVINKWDVGDARVSLLLIKAHSSDSLDVRYTDGDSVGEVVQELMKLTKNLTSIVNL